MKSWKYFEQCSDRSLQPNFVETDREGLELLVATQVAEILSQFGIIDQVDIDASANPHVDESRTYYALGVAPMDLADDSTFEIGQFPYTSDLGSGISFESTPGAHCVAVLNDNCGDALNITVWDPAVPVLKRIHLPNGDSLPFDMLHELHETIQIYRTLLPELDEQVLNEDPTAKDGRPHTTKHFPLPATDPEFAAIVSQL